MKMRAKAAIAGIALTTGATMLLGVPSATGDHQSSSSAYGVSVGGQAGQPAVEYDGGETQTGGGELPAQLGPLAAGGVLTLSAGNDNATAKVTDLTLAQALAELPDELKDGIDQLTQACTAFDQAGDLNQAIDPLNDAINQIPGIGTVVELPSTEEASEFCNALLDNDILSLAKIGTLQTECNDKTGTVTLTDVEVLGAEQPVLAGEVAKDTQLLPAELAPVATITLNHQTTKGENFTVDGLRVEVGGQLVAVVASTTCGGPIAHEPNTPEPAPAPKPTPTPAPVPVTG
jgi:hypothetical protein